jgi:hypothetical protein
VAGNMFKSIKSKIFKNLFYVYKNDKKIFSYKEEGDKLLIIPYIRYFNSTVPFYINKNELEDVVNKVIIE